MQRDLGAWCSWVNCLDHTPTGRDVASDFHIWNDRSWLSCYFPELEVQYTARCRNPWTVNNGWEEEAKRTRVLVVCRRFTRNDPDAKEMECTSRRAASPPLTTMTLCTTMICLLRQTQSPNSPVAEISVFNGGPSSQRRYLPIYDLHTQMLCRLIELLF